MNNSVMSAEKFTGFTNVNEDQGVNIETRRRGRPVVKDSERQKRLAAYEAKKAAGIEVKRGRPVNSDSERQKRLAERESKLANGGLKRGRPVDANSERQKRLAARVTKSDAASLGSAE